MTVISVLRRCIDRFKNRQPFDPIENKAFLEFLNLACDRESNMRMVLNLLHIRAKMYDKKGIMTKSEEIWLLAYLEGALLNHELV